MFLAAAQTVRPGAGMQLVVHSGEPLATVAAGVATALREADPRIAISFRVFDRQIDEHHRPRAAAGDALNLLRRRGGVLALSASTA